MRKLHHFRMPKQLQVLAFSMFALLFSGASLAAQTPQNKAIPEDTARAGRLVERGDTKIARDLLKKIVEKRPDDAYAWYYLGLAHKREEEMCAARIALLKATSFRPEPPEATALLASILATGNGEDIQSAGVLAERALVLGLDNADVRYALSEAQLQADNYARALAEAEAALLLEAKHSGALLVKARALNQLKRRQDAAAALSEYLATAPDDDDLDLWRETLARWQSPLEKPKPVSPEAAPVVFRPTEVTVKARVLSKPTPNYTEKARRNCLSGTVVLQMVLSSNGEVTGVRTISGLPSGLTREAIKAAHRITFEPALKDGKPVSQYIRVEYNFNIY
jgi:TonB family protein